MTDAARRLAAVVAAGVLVVFVVVVIGETSRVVELAARVHPLFGTIVLWVLLAVYAAAVVYPIVGYLRLPPRLEPPEVAEGPDFERHLANLARRLARAPGLPDRPPEGRDEIEDAIAQLGGAADGLSKETARKVFLSTAISQSGRLDAIAVLWANARLVWQIAHVYYQRPSVRDLVSLYGNVAGAALISGEIDDVDIAEQVEPILSSVLGGAAASVPGLQAASGILLNSVLTGSANALLTLRLGILAKEYSAPIVHMDRRAARRSATTQAAALLGGVVTDGTRRLVAATGRAMRGKAGSWLRKVTPGRRRDDGEEAPVPDEVAVPDAGSVDA